MNTAPKRWRFNFFFTSDLKLHFTIISSKLLLITIDKFIFMDGDACLNICSFYNDFTIYSDWCSRSHWRAVTLTGS